MADDINGQVGSLMKRLDPDKLMYLLDTLTDEAIRKLRWLNDLDTFSRGLLKKFAEHEEKRRRMLISLNDTIIQIDNLQPLLAIADEWAKLQEEGE